MTEHILPNISYGKYDQVVPILREGAKILIIGVKDDYNPKTKPYNTFLVRTSDQILLWIDDVNKTFADVAP